MTLVCHHHTDNINYEKHNSTTSNYLSSPGIIKNEKSSKQLGKGFKYFSFSCCVSTDIIMVLLTYILFDKSPHKKFTVMKGNPLQTKTPFITPL